MKILLAVVLLALPLWCAWAFYVATRSGRLTWWRALIYALGFFILLLGNPLANAYLLSPIDGSLQRALFQTCLASRGRRTSSRGRSPSFSTRRARSAWLRMERHSSSTCGTDPSKDSARGPARHCA